MIMITAMTVTMTMTMIVTRAECSSFLDQCACEDLRLPLVFYTMYRYRLTPTSLSMSRVLGGILW